MSHIFQRQIYSFDLCHAGTIKPSSLMKYMQVSATLDLDGLGLTYQFMRSYNMVFVLTKFKLQMYEKINDKDIIDIRTWAKETKGVTFIREFDIKKEGRIVGYASTQWALMDFVARCPIRPSKLPYPIPDEDIEGKDIELERHIKYPDTAVLKGKFTRKVMLSDLDENLHLNNTVYSDIMLDFLPLNISGDHFETLQINFHGEARLDDILEIEVFLDANTVYYFAENVTKAHQCFEGKMKIAD